MAKNIRKLFAEVDKNLKGIDEVLYSQYPPPSLIKFMLLGNTTTRQSGDEAAERAHSDHEGKV